MAELTTIPPAAPNQPTIELLERLLELAKEGSLRSFVGILGHSDGAHGHCWEIDPHLGSRRLLGEMQVAQHNMVTDLALEDPHSSLSKALGRE